MLKERRDKMQEIGKKGHGLIKIIVKEHLPHLPWLTRNMMHHFITTYTNENIVPAVIQTKHQTVVSRLTDFPSPVSAATHRAAEPITTTELVIAMEPVFTTEDGTLPVTSPASTNTHDTSNKGGRPNGSTHTAMNVRQSFYTEALNESAIEVAFLEALSQERSQTLGKKCRLPRGAFDKAITKMCEKYKLERHEIHLHTELTRNKSGHTLKHRGTVSSISCIEDHLLCIILRRANPSTARLLC
jgi:hypothetical protein